METALAIGYVAVFALLGVAIWRVSRPRRPSEEARAAEAAARVGLPAPDDRQFIADLEAQMKAYGAAIADFYDTTTGD